MSIGTRTRTRHAWTRTIAAMAFAAAAACGGGSDAPQSAPAGGAESRGTPAASSAGPAPNRCPLTAEQVTAAVGSPVKGPDSSCSFFPLDEAKAFPNAGFNWQLSHACSSAGLADLEYREQIEGLGTTAYVADWADGSHLLICRGNTPFEIRVDLADNERARAAAVTLARHVLGAS